MKLTKVLNTKTMKDGRTIILAKGWAWEARGWGARYYAKRTRYALLVEAGDGRFWRMDRSHKVHRDTNKAEMTKTMNMIVRGNWPEGSYLDGTATWRLN